MSRNPILTDKAFDPANYGGTTTTGVSPAEEWQRAQAGHGMATGSVDARLQGGAPPGPVVTGGRTMTLGGTAWATLLLLVVAAAVGVYGWSTVTETPVPLAQQVVGEPTVTTTLDQPVMLFVALFGALGVAILTAFKPRFARFTGLLYAALEGYVLGTISHLYDAQFNGIVIQAILGTAGVFIAMLALYGLRILRVTPRMTKAIVGATFGILLMYGVAFIVSLFGVDMGFVYGTDGGAFGIVLSLVIVGVAAFNLLLDFDFIERGSKAGLPAYMEWYGAFGLMVTLVWIYIEMLRLFARMRN
ncbi:MAG: Bax inhibitor-1/YccA family protein [Microthrixaceae bacterium]|nr:Bax inhibitor-1/YccA family protein [Microthrixaceae bacterium]